MACSVITFRPMIVAASGNRVDNGRADARKSTSAKWWTPIFGFPSDPDYIKQEVEPDLRSGGIKYEPGSFTENKAKQLRRMTNVMASFHDGMYHSGVASKLASDFGDRSAPS